MRERNEMSMIVLSGNRKCVPPNTLRETLSTSLPLFPSRKRKKQRKRKRERRKEMELITNLHRWIHSHGNSLQQWYMHGHSNRYAHPLRPHCCLHCCHRRSKMMVWIALASLCERRTMDPYQGNRVLLHDMNHCLLGSKQRLW